jgi:topoisomerase-4 subunit B
MARSKAYLFRRGGNPLVGGPGAPGRQGFHTPQKAVLHFPGGLKDYLDEAIQGRPRVTDEIFTGNVEEGRRPRLGRVGGGVVRRGEGFVNSYCNTVPTPEGGTHEQGLRLALARSLKNYAELSGKKRGEHDHHRRRDGLGRHHAVGVHPRAGVQGQTKDKLATTEASRIVDKAVSDHFDHWLTGIRPRPTSCWTG